MAEAKNAEEALRLLADTDYGKTQVRDVHDFEEMIQNNLEESYESIQKLIPNETFMNIFTIKPPPISPVFSERVKPFSAITSARRF